MKQRVAIVDTNVVVAGLLTPVAEAPTALIVDGMLDAAFPFAVSVELLAEYRSVLLRRRVRARHRLGAEQIDEILAAIAAEAIVREPAVAGEKSPDAGDQHLWDLLAALPGAVLITGDRALADEAGRGARVVSPREWLESTRARPD